MPARTRPTQLTLIALATGTAMAVALSIATAGDALAFGGNTLAQAGVKQQGTGQGRSLAPTRIDSSTAASIVRDRTGSRVLGVRRDSLGGRAVYRVKVLTTEGRVKTVRVDANSGSILR